MDKKLRESLLKRIKPSDKERLSVSKKLDKFLGLLRVSTDNLGFECEFFVGGSFGKNTNLKGDFDVDVFCRFSKKYDEKLISSYLEKIIKTAKIKCKRQKGSRDYFSGNYGFDFELVPVIRIDNASEAKNSTDVSPLHVSFIQEKVKKNKKLSDEIRITKQFLKAQELYGAESYIEGFSGHVVDILITYYGSFEKLLSEASKWDSRTIIDVSLFYKSEKSILSGIEKDKHSNLIVVDPIIKTRNAARALSHENYSRFVVISKTLDKLVSSHFSVKKETKSDMLKRAKKFAKENNLHLLYYDFKFEKETSSTPDIMGSKLLRLFKIMGKKFIEYDFRVFHSEFKIDIGENYCLYLYFFENIELPKLKRIVGPYVSMEDGVSKFVKSKKNYFIEKDRLYSYEKRKITNLSEVCKFSSRSDFEKILGKKLDFLKSIVGVLK